VTLSILENGSTMGCNGVEAPLYGPVAMQKAVGSSPIIRLYTLQNGIV
jgi:hypothetical protein